MDTWFCLDFWLDKIVVGKLFCKSILLKVMHMCLNPHKLMCFCCLFRDEGSCLSARLSAVVLITKQFVYKQTSQCALTKVYMANSTYMPLIVIISTSRACSRSIISLWLASWIIADDKAYTYVLCYILLVLV